MVADSINASGVLENVGVAVGIIFLAYMGANIAGGSTESPFLQIAYPKSLDTPGLTLTQTFYA
jgi:hypothetical protein